VLGALIAVSTFPPVPAGANVQDAIVAGCASAVHLLSRGRILAGGAMSTILAGYTTPLRTTEAFARLINRSRFAKEIVHVSAFAVAVAGEASRRGISVLVLTAVHFGVTGVALAQAPPILQKQFSPASIPVYGSTTLAFSSSTPIRSS
jgi:hypothetical protein